MATFLVPSPEAFSSATVISRTAPLSLSSVCAVFLTQGVGGCYHGDGNIEARCPWQVPTAGGQLSNVNPRPWKDSTSWLNNPSLISLTDMRITQNMWHLAEGFSLECHLGSPQCWQAHRREIIQSSCHPGTFLFDAFIYYKQWSLNPFHFLSI